MLDVNLNSIEVENVYTWDWPDLVDAVAVYAETHDGRPLNSEELDKLNDNQDIIQQAAREQLLEG